MMGSSCKKKKGKKCDYKIGWWKMRGSEGRRKEENHYNQDVVDED